MKNTLRKSRVLGDRILVLRPPRIAMTLVLIAATLHYSLPTVEITLSSWPVAAAFLATCGFAVMLRAWWLFKSRGTAICPTATTTVLITDDVFALSRNPMYLGMLMMLLALALYFASLPFYSAACIYFMTLNNVYCRYEEQKLARDFGSAYISYRRRVRRWL